MQDVEIRIGLLVMHRFQLMHAKMNNITRAPKESQSTG